MQTTEFFAGSGFREEKESAFCFSKGESRMNWIQGLYKYLVVYSDSR